MGTSYNQTPPPVLYASLDSFSVSFPTTTANHMINLPCKTVDPFLNLRGFLSWELYQMVMPRVLASTPVTPSPATVVVAAPSSRFTMQQSFRKLQAGTALQYRLLGHMKLLMVNPMLLL
ncbi:hypothetical protein M9H77_30111 [Catharanthus roseus]|uniref:Uncharacterized protein n=1 Tax=Catharanthus roseus TaxID=4058 RepID=A0ACB9ZX57_CATRO|nr:hypothetical protein M9H77_30111 [Catharanthus roseus]